jgi:hypothetical protein
MLLLLLLFWIGGICAVAGCPSIFVIQPPLLKGIPVDYGTYMLRNRTQLNSDFYLPPAIYEGISSMFYCHTINVITTDDAVMRAKDIQLWIEAECERLGQSPCLVRDYTSTKKWITAQASVTTNRIETLEDPPTDSPTTESPTTSAPTTAKLCINMDTPADCALVANGCHWFGFLMGCHDVTHCELPSMQTCLLRSRYCIWRGRRCVSK